MDEASILKSKNKCLNLIKEPISKIHRFIIKYYECSVVHVNYLSKVPKMIN